MTPHDVERLLAVAANVPPDDGAAALQALNSIGAGLAGMLPVAAADAPPAAWPDAPHLPGPPEPDPLPLDALPPVLRTHVASVSGATQTPADLGLLLALAAVSAAVRGRADVLADARRGWRETVCVYSAAILPPGARKSPVYAEMTAPLEAWEREARERDGPAYRRARDRVDVAVAALTTAKGAAAREKGSTGAVEAARGALDAAEAAVPVWPEVVASDATPEGLVDLMAAQRGPIALMGPEADPLAIADGRYGDGAARVDELLRAWAAEPIKVHRRNREPVRVDRPVLTLGLALQPAALHALRNARTLRGRGLLGRVLWCVPPHGLGSRLTGRDAPAADAQAARSYARVLRHLLDAATATEGVYTLDIAGDGQDVLHGYEAEVERELAEGARLAGISDWASKVHGQAVRLAALSELAARAEDGRPLWNAPIGPWAMEAGVRLARALTTHALVVLSDIGVDRRTADLRYVLRRAREIPEGSTERDLHDATRDRPGLATMDDLRPLVEDLVERGCIRLVEQMREGPGRPPSPLVEVHPVLRRQTPDRPPQYPQNEPAEPNAGVFAGIAGANPGERPGRREVEL